MQQIPATLLKSIAAVLLAGTIAAATACSAMYPNDKRWIPQDKFEAAKTVYDQTDSLALTREKLEAEPTWTHAEVNEAIYRLRKLYRIEDDK